MTAARALRHLASAALLAIVGVSFALAQAKIDWPVHDLTRPMARVVDPGSASQAPADAVVLFDGKDLSKWKSQKSGGPAEWKVEGGYFEVVKGKGGIQTIDGFGDCQLHLEWMSPNPPVGESQELSVTLDAGTYVLLCNIYDEDEAEAHYHLGMRTAFTVTD